MEMISIGDCKDYYGEKMLLILKVNHTIRQSSVALSFLQTLHAKLYVANFWALLHPKPSRKV